jgi:hypothetical protein
MWGEVAGYALAVAGGRTPCCTRGGRRGACRHLRDVRHRLSHVPGTGCRL